MTEENSENKTNESKPKNTWQMASIVLVVLLAISIVVQFTPTGMVVANELTEDEVTTNVMNFVNSVLGAQGVKASLISVSESHGLYKITVNINGQETDLYGAKDGEVMFTGEVPLEVRQQSPTPSQPVPSQPVNTNVPKSDKPEAELFIMTHCPYGTQAEKGFIPAIKALGDSIDAKIRFVHYFMHDPEKPETPRQVCIREEQPDKWYDYLECFLEDGDAERCLAEVGIDESNLDDCINNGKSDEYYKADSALSKKYGVGGSPTLVINGVRLAPSRQYCSEADETTGKCIVYSVSRSAEGMKTAICSAFNTPPKECDTQLSSASPSPGFGWGTTSGTANPGAGCGA